ncbi:unnamed protein product [Rotaria magnacalcarata]|uniref:Uncharacterized protein n=2 Tax=Rotaria magnacalcarata TaxID=392030 RepID=A0A815FMA4_9BILA|nr:unnamed protein product [Rotaria magnacalcarata]CAF1978631.1 unnamed protein product [Rotaria magnacalcarata]CAF3748914.1 unnamed protein product [Rotaria magnacalcarata]CAF3781381.1 unnamed protein product [Rotaria magnacalcarata]CAF5021856.1 unnamed protein product [Rotaria magnacalcarata]
MFQKQNSTIKSSEIVQTHSITKLHKRKKQKSHRRSRKNVNSTKLKSKYRKKNHRSPIKNNFEQLSLNANSFNENQTNNNEIPFDTDRMVQDHLYISIMGLLCFFPTGIFGLIRAMQASEMKRSSSLLYWPKLAAIYGRHALRWAILSILIGTMLWTIFIIYHLLREQHPLWDAYYQECGEQFLCSL